MTTTASSQQKHFPSTIRLSRTLPPTIDDQGKLRRESAEALLQGIIHEVKRLGYGSHVTLRLAVSVPDNKDFMSLSTIAATFRTKQRYRKEFQERVSLRHDHLKSVIHVFLNVPRRPRREHRR